MKCRLCNVSGNSYKGRNLSPLSLLLPVCGIIVIQKPEKEKIKSRNYTGNSIQANNAKTLFPFDTEASHHLFILFGPIFFSFSHAIMELSQVRRNHCKSFNSLHSSF